jgi:hypothetical protein
MKRKVALTIGLCAVVAGGALAVNPSLMGGGQSGTHNVLDSGRDPFWSEPPDFEGLIASSEVIGVYGLETEIANDFYFTTDGLWVQLARWWGGYWNNYGCSDIGYATYWNLRIYDDGGCVPNTVIWELVAAFANETSVYCQSGMYPIFQYEAGGGMPSFSANTLYWFGAQAADHTFPPQCGRLASAGVVGCDTVFKSAYFSFPDWTPAIDVFGVAFDASQEFDYGEIGHDETGACCFADGHCEQVYSSNCIYSGGEYQGDGVPCDPNPCEPSPTRSTTWGRIKSDYR